MSFSFSFLCGYISLSATLCIKGHTKGGLIVDNRPNMSRDYLFDYVGPDLKSYHQALPHANNQCFTYLRGASGSSHRVSLSILGLYA